MRPGERLLLYTDGLTEAENANGESFGDVMLPRFIREHEALDVDAFADGLQHAVREWSLSGKHGQADDITFIVADLIPLQQRQLSDALPDLSRQMTSSSNNRQLL